MVQRPEFLKITVQAPECSGSSEEHSVVFIARTTRNVFVKILSSYEMDCNVDNKSFVINVV